MAPFRCYSLSLLFVTKYVGNVWSWLPSNLSRNTAIFCPSSHPHAVAKATSGSYTDNYAIDAADAIIPLDETFSKNPFKKFIGSLLSAGQISTTKAAVHDEALEVNGGVWKSFFLNKSFYSTTGHVPSIVRQLAKSEARGHLENDFPEYIVNVLGKESLIAARDLKVDDSYFKAKKVLVDALSTQNILKGQIDGIYKELARLNAHWGTVADQDGTIIFHEDVNTLTYNVIINAVFGERDVSQQDMDTFTKCTSDIEKGFVAIPTTIPILRKLPFFRRYTRAFEARNIMKSIVEEKIEKKRDQLKRSKVDPTVRFDSSGILDDFILQMDSSDGLPEEKVINFCVDNTILSIFAGFKTSASLMTNIMLILESDSDARDKVRQELSSFEPATIPKNQLEIFDSLPALKSVFLEASRYRPAVGNSFRKTTAPVIVGGVRIPTGSTVRMSNIYGGLSEKLYDAPEKICPLRFYNDRSDKIKTEAHSLNKEEGQPTVFGYGKHLCPGLYLAQMEIALVTKQFLCNYDYELVEGQDLRTKAFNAPRSGLILRLRKR